MYISAAIFLDRLGLTELTKLMNARLGASLDADALNIACDEGDLTGVIAEVASLASEAKQLIDQAIVAVGNTIDGYVSGVRTLPLSSEVIAQSPLQNVAFALLKYELMQRADKQTQEDFQHAMSQLRDIAKGMIRLGQDDPAPSPKASIRVGHSASRFDFKGYGR